MGRTICTAGFPSAAIASSCFTARCDSIWYGFFIATPFSRQKKLLLAYQDFERGVATFYDLPGIPSDVPAFSIVNQYRGRTFAVYKPRSVEHFQAVEKLQKENRV